MIFFNAENGIYDDSVIKLVNKYNYAQSRIWHIAIENTPESRRPLSSVSDKQSFDVYCRNKNKNPMKTQQGVDIEVELAESVGMPIALVGTVREYSSEYAFEKIREGDWAKLIS